MADLDGEFYLARINCEFAGVAEALCREQGANLVKSYQSEREDWILTMVAAGMGVCFLPEYTAIFPGVVACPLVSPSIARNVSFVTVAGRRWSAPVAALVRAMRRHPWPSASVVPNGPGSPAA
jgi:DNA-binding transcriptional LysR family regulator